MPSSAMNVTRLFTLLLITLLACLLLTGCGKQYGGKSTAMTVTANPTPEQIYVIRHSDWMRNGQDKLLRPEHRAKLERLASRTSGRSPLTTTLYRGYQYMFIVERGEGDLVAYGPHQTSGAEDDYTINY